MLHCGACSAVWCSMVRCGAVCCSVLQCVAACHSVVQCGATWCKMLKCCSVLQCVAVMTLDVACFLINSSSLEPHTEELWIQIITTTKISGIYLYLQQLLQQLQHE